MCKAVEEFGNKKKLEGKIEGIKEGKIAGIREGKVAGIKEGKIAGIKEGKIAGIKEGRIKGKIETAKNMVAEGLDLSFISKMLEVPESCVKEWLA